MGQYGTCGVYWTGLIPKGNELHWGLKVRLVKDQCGYRIMFFFEHNFHFLFCWALNVWLVMGRHGFFVAFVDI